MNSLPSEREIVLLGTGPTNLHVLRIWCEAPIRQARLTCVSDFLAATYSGMLPGTLAGLYSPERMQIDLVRLCQAAGARLIRAEVAGLDRQRRELFCRDGPPIPFDVLSIGIGSVPRDKDILLDPSVVRIKPMQTFLPRLDERLRQLAASRAAENLAAGPLRIAVVGGGAGGVEIALCLPTRLGQAFGSLAYELSLIESGSRLLAGFPRRADALARREFQRRGVNVLLGHAARSIQDGQLTMKDGTMLPFDLIVLATGPQPPVLLSQLGLSLDAEGFLLTRPTLQSIDDPGIFVVGDAGTIQGRQAPKAGVYAVRQGPVLWGNLHRTIYGRPLLEYKPQRQFLSILATGDRQAILSYKGLTFCGRWCWRIKDSIDSRFLDRMNSRDEGTGVGSRMNAGQGSQAANSRG
jgi:selenide,water dikinase